MLTLTKLLGKTIIDNDNLQLGTLTELRLDKPEWKCAVATASGIFSSDNLKIDGEYIQVSNTDNNSYNILLNLGKTVYDVNGNLLGNITDIELNKSMRLVNVVVSNGEKYSRGKIRALGDVMLVKLPTEKNADKEPDRKTKKTNKTVLKKNNDLVIESKSAKALPQQPYPNKRKYGDFSFFAG